MLPLRILGRLLRNFLNTVFVVNMNIDTTSGKMYRVVLYVSLTTAVFLIGDRRHVTATKCQSRLNCTDPKSQFCCKNYSASYSPRICLQTCAGRPCESDNDCGGTGGECCNTVDEKCTTQQKCVKKCDVEMKCGVGTYCCKQTYLNPSICASSCVGKSCFINSDCGGPGECCSSGNECTTNCNGSSIPTSNNDLLL